MLSPIYKSVQVIDNRATGELISRYRMAISMPKWKLVKRVGLVNVEHLDLLERGECQFTPELFDRFNKVLGKSVAGEILK